MSRPIFTAVLSVGLLFSIAAGIDVSKTKKTDIQLTNDDIVPKTQVKQLSPSPERAPTFIGDVAAGVRYPNEVVYRRILHFDNPTNVIQSSSTQLRVTNGIINYINITNEPGSYAVACVEESTLGSSIVVINLRVPANSSSHLILVVAAH